MYQQTIEPLFVKMCVKGINLSDIAFRNETIKLGFELGEACVSAISGQVVLGVFLLIAFIIFVGFASQRI